MHEGAKCFDPRSLTAQVVEDSCEAGDHNGGKDEPPGMDAEVQQNLRLDFETDSRDKHRCRQNAPRAEASDAAGAHGNGSFAFVGHPESAVERDGEIRGYADDDCVPIENASIGAESKIRPKRLEEIAVRIERNPTDDVAERGAEKDGQQRTGKTEHQVPGRRPDRPSDKAAEFNRDSAQNEKP